MTNRAKIEEIKHLISEYDANLNREQARFIHEIEMSAMTSIVHSSQKQVFPQQSSIEQKNAVVESLLFRIEAVLETSTPEEKT